MRSGWRKWGVLAGVVGVMLAPPASAEISDDVVRILVMPDLSSVTRESGGSGSVTAAEMAVDRFDGEVDGSEVELIIEDQGTEADDAVALAKRIHSETPIDMITGHQWSSVGLALQEWATGEDIVILHSGPSSTAFTGEKCSPVGVQWSFDTYALASASVKATIAEGDTKWFFLTADYEFGHDMQKQAARLVEANGGTILGNEVVAHPAVDFSFPLQEAITSDADVIGLANVGGDTQLAIRQGYELGVRQAGLNMVGLEFTITDIRRLGLYVTAGLRFATSFYWNENETTREWSEAFSDRTGLMPTWLHAGVFSATTHYLEAVQATESDDASTVMKHMRDNPVDDGVFAKRGQIRRDGRMVHDMILVQVKRPSRSSGSWDYLEVLRTISGNQAFRPMAEGNCPL